MKILNTVRILALICTGLLAGIFAANLAGLPARNLLVGAERIIFLQETHVYYQRMMPPIVLGAVLSCLVWVILAWRRGATGEAVFAAGAFVLTAVYFAITVVVNFPINDALMTWSPTSPPADHLEIWARWEHATNYRTVLSFLAFACSATAATFARFRGD